MGNLLTIEIDNEGLLEGLTRFGAFAGKHLKDAAYITAQNVRREARARVRRATGATAQGITVEETHQKDGYVVFPFRPENPGLPGWIEMGTEKMKARPFLLNSARLEEGAHLRRIAEALDYAAEDAGLGD